MIDVTSSFRLSVDGDRCARTGGRSGRAAVSSTHEAGRFKRWLLSERIEQVEGPETRESKGRQQSWWKVVA